MANLLFDKYVQFEVATRVLEATENTRSVFVYMFYGQRNFPCAA